MAASTVPTQVLPNQVVGYLNMPVKASVKIPQGVAVCINTSGYADNAADTTSYVFVGFAVQTADNTNGTDGAISVLVSPLTDNQSRFFLAPCTGATQGWVAVHAFWLDNVTVAQAGSTSHTVIAGGVVQYISSTQVMVDGAERFARATS